MPTATYDLIASNVLTSNTSTVTFSNLNSVAAAYRDLIIVAHGFSTSTQRLAIRYNGDSGVNYRNFFVQGGGASPYVDEVTSSELFVDYSDVRWSASGKNFTIIHIFDFAQTDKHKTSLHRTNMGSFPGTTLGVGRWASTSAITSIELTVPSISFASGSAFYLYGIVS